MSVKEEIKTFARLASGKGSLSLGEVKFVGAQAIAVTDAFARDLKGLYGDAVHVFFEKVQTEEATVKDEVSATEKTVEKETTKAETAADDAVTSAIEEATKTTKSK